TDDEESNMTWRDERCPFLRSYGKRSRLPRYLSQPGMPVLPSPVIMNEVEGPLVTAADNVNWKARGRRSGFVTAGIGFLCFPSPISYPCYLRNPRLKKTFVAERDVLGRTFTHQKDLIFLS